MRKLYLFLVLVATMLVSSVGAQAAKVYFNNPNEWTTVNAYIYKGAHKNAEWPGVSMAVATGDTYYSVDIPTNCDGGYVIFNNGSGTQYPSATGLQITAGKSMIFAQDKTTDSNNIWTEYNEAQIEVYFDNSTENWATPYFYYWGVKGDNSWPGAAMTVKEGSTWKATLPVGTAGVIFTNGASSGTLQSVNFVAEDGATYNKNEKTSGGSSAPVGEAFTVYFDNSSKNWATPKIHYWGGTTESTWPGVNMTLESGKVYEYTVPAGTTGIIFNDGNGNQTGDILNPTANHLYDGNGTDKGEYTPGTGGTVEAPAELYILGTVGTTFWATTPGISMTKSDKKFTATGVEIKASKAGSEYGYFTLVTAVGADWNAVNASDRFGAPAEDAELTDGTASTMQLYEKNVDASAAKSWKLAAGKYTIEADFSTMKVTATLTGSGPIAGTGALAVTPVTINPGRDATIEISIADASKVMKALQFDVTLPSCVTAGAPLISRTMGSHTLMSSTVDGKLRVVIFSESNEEFSSTNGAIIYLPVTASATAAVGDYDVKLSNITFADADLLAVKAADITATGAIKVQAASDYTITLSKTVLALAPNATETLTATVTPDDGTTKTITWTSSDSDVATVDATTGLVTAVANGTATITASCAGATPVTCTVYVGKQAQTITWTQTIAPLGVGEADVTLNATASSGLTVTYEITSGSAYATIVDGKLHAKAPGLVTVTATQAGNETYAPAEPVSKTVTIWLGYIEGDVNGDSYITMADAVATVNHIIGANPDPFNEDAADVDGDGDITVADVAQIVQKVLDNVAPAPASKPARIAGYAGALEQFSATASGYNVRVSFTNQENYVATLFEVNLPEGYEITAASMAGSNHAVLTRRVNDTTTRVAVYSIKNSTFAADGYVNLTLNQAQPSEASLNNASIVSTDGVNTEEYEALGSEIHVTGLVDINADNDADAVYYNLQGVRVSNPANGVYVRVSGNKAAKVLVK